MSKLFLVNSCPLRYLGSLGLCFSFLFTRGTNRTIVEALTKNDFFTVKTIINWHEYSQIRVALRNNFSISYEF
ncbi:protein of unknown function [Candidatus Nitrosotalea okcheonensis]|uniref:Uncharacterized protein n=1 Tax=Candidatus Nitrosotalea okcheonensis TaxID=1903276 RepID=A0A2H1FCA0_9ARCH|nr:protein of unknown function [Candidatus Nitrosotalea okcheonensis]